MFQSVISYFQKCLIHHAHQAPYIELAAADKTRYEEEYAAHLEEHKEEIEAAEAASSVGEGGKGGSE